MDMVGEGSGKLDNFHGRHMCIVPNKLFQKVKLFKYGDKIMVEGIKHFFNIHGYHVTRQWTFLELVYGWFNETKTPLMVGPKGSKIFWYQMPLEKHISVSWKNLCFWIIHRLFHLAFPWNIDWKMFKKLFFGIFFWVKKIIQKKIPPKHT